MIGISLLAACTFRLRRKVGAAWERRTLTAELRSAGVEIDREPFDAFGALGMGRAVYVRDPDGYRIELKTAK